MKILVALVFSLVVCGCFGSEEGIPGKCPHIDYVKGFTPWKMTGKWWSIYQSGKQESCLFYEFEQATPGHYHGYYYNLNATVALNPKNPEIVGEGYVISSKFHPELDKLNVKTFATDYDGFAGIYSCKEVGDVHYAEISLWSRTKSLDNEKIEEMKGILAKYRGFEATLKAVDNENCPY